MATTHIRQRVPFRFSEGDESQGILDDHEQEELIDSLRSQNASSSKQQLLAIGVIILLSCTLQLIYMLSSSKASPLFAVAPTKPNTGDYVPIPNVFSCLSIAIHLNLVMLLYPKTIQDWTNFNIKPLSYAAVVPLSAVAPTVCILFGCSWQTVVWWSATAFVVLTTRIVQTSIAANDESINRLERLRYPAPGA